MVRLSVQIGDERFVQTDFQIKDFSALAIQSIICCKADWHTASAEFIYRLVRVATQEP